MKLDFSSTLLPIDSTNPDMEEENEKRWLIIAKKNSIEESSVYAFCTSDMSGLDFFDPEQINLTRFYLLVFEIFRAIDIPVRRTVWKTTIKCDHYFYGKINIFSVKSTLLLKKLLKAVLLGM